VEGEKRLSDDTWELYKTGLQALRNNSTLDALVYIERALKIEPDNQDCLSVFGFCIAKERGQLKEGIRLCENAVRSESKNAENYLNLGRLYQLAGIDQKAIHVFRKGLEIDRNNREIISELQALGLRKNPVISCLSRNNFINKYLGIIFSRIGIR
jgi:tetratricopeptide (TPR) repeat protein